MYYKKKSQNLTSHEKKVLQVNSRSVSVAPSDIDSGSDNEVELPSQTTFVENKSDKSNSDDDEPLPKKVDRMYDYYVEVCKTHNGFVSSFNKLQKQADDLDIFYDEFKKEHNVDYDFLRAMVKDEETERKQDVAEL